MQWEEKKIYSIKRICWNIKTRYDQIWKTNIYTTSHLQKATSISVKNTAEQSQETQEKKYP